MPVFRLRIVFLTLVVVLGLYFLHHLSSSPSTSTYETGNNVHSIPGSSGSPKKTALDNDWNKFAYLQYVTKKDYLCSAVMVIAQLAALNSKADKVLMYPAEWQSTSDTAATTFPNSLLLEAKTRYGAKLMPINLVKRPGQDNGYSDSFTKLLAFNQTQYDRVLMLDSDASVVRNLDNLFTDTPPAVLAVPVAYWLPKKPKPTLGSYFMLITPSAKTYERIAEAIAADSPREEYYDMDVVNSLFSSKSPSPSELLVLPHRPYTLLTGEFRKQKDEHKDWMGHDSKEEWLPDVILKEVYYIHFSDYPLPKPWILPENSEWTRFLPKCRSRIAEGEDCEDRIAWERLYLEYRERRERVCGLKVQYAPL